MCRQSCGLPLGGDDSSLSWISSFCLEVPSISLCSCWLFVSHLLLPCRLCRALGPSRPVPDPSSDALQSGALTRLSPGCLSGTAQWLKTCLCCVGVFLAVTWGWNVSGARWKPPSQEKWEPLSDPRPQHRQLCSSPAFPCQGLKL